ncbi:MAG TPA: transcriptional regulator [Brevundimonas sp.]|uniref:winged helix-turn-helix domain-containing protein n=1 Tax=Brevundimonas sp. TaxID=1871086 RepID=UPI002622872A|nr:transcriptional regulator [Brevundimonas sp.]HRO33630.1 transcriptional regulator [Brevundimonas sp.]
MASGGYRFEGFELDPADRRLTRDGVTVDLNARYLDALILLVREQGRLVPKDRFLDEVWKGVPVTDEALTQCIRTLRRALGDDAARPHFIATAPKHGYRFIAAIETPDDTAAPPGPIAAERTALPQPFLTLGVAGVAGGGLAGLIGGLIYGLVGAADASQGGVGALSVLLVMVCLTTMLAVVGAAGVCFGMVAAARIARRFDAWSIVGGAGGGLLVGAVVKLLGADASTLLFGRSPGDITGAPEGALLGAAVGLAAWLTVRRTRRGSLRLGVATAAVCGLGAGLMVALVGGRLMGGSLDLLADQFPGSRLRLDAFGRLFGEDGFGPISHVLSAGLEGLLFCACIVGTMILARRRFRLFRPRA